MQHEADYVVHAEQGTWHRGLELVGHPVRGMWIEFVRRVNESSRTASPIDKPLNDTDRHQGNGRNAPRALVRCGHGAFATGRIECN
jgi:hypothetical protein